MKAATLGEAASLLPSLPAFPETIPPQVILRVIRE